MLKLLKLFSLILFIAVLFYFAAYSFSINTPVDINGKDVPFTVEKGESIKTIAGRLEKAGLIKSQIFFETYVWLEKKQANFQAGDYTLNPRLNAKDIAQVFIKGATLSKEKEIKIIEGWTTKDIGEYLDKENVGKKENFYELAGYPVSGYKNGPSAIKVYSKDFSFLGDKPKLAGLEGYLFPDTYRIFKDAKIEDVINKMLANFDKKLTQEMRADIAKQGKSVFQIVTMASLVEKEVQSADDMKIVSGIFWNRIKNGQALESCATLAYVLGVNKPIYSTADTKVNSPYNTYEHQGLPPGPISNPSLKAITAAIYPADTQYNYFLSRPDTGETVFSKTYEEHLNNKAKYLK